MNKLLTTQKFEQTGIMHFLSCIDQALLLLLDPQKGNSLERLQLLEIQINNLFYEENFLARTCGIADTKIDRKQSSFEVNFCLTNQNEADVTCSVKFFLRGQKEYLLQNEEISEEKFINQITLSIKDINDFLISINKPNLFFTDKSLLALIGKTDILIPSQLLIALALQFVSKNTVNMKFYNSAKADEPLFIYTHDSGFHFKNKLGELILKVQEN